MQTIVIDKTRLFLPDYEPVSTENPLSIGVVAQRCRIRSCTVCGGPAPDFLPSAVIAHHGRVLWCKGFHDQGVRKGASLTCAVQGEPHFVSLVLYVSFASRQC